jgi:hypothetical protein
MILPNSNSGNANTDQMFRLIDEKLSELYSIHGKAYIRDTFESKEDITAGGQFVAKNPIKLASSPLNNTEIPVFGNLYPNAIVRGYGRCLGTGVLQDGFNVSVTHLGTGFYQWGILNPQPNDELVYIVSVKDYYIMPGYINPMPIVAGIWQSNGWVHLYGINHSGLGVAGGVVIDLYDAEHSVIILGQPIG